MYKVTKLKKLLIAFATLVSLVPTYTHAQSNYWVPFVGGALFGYVISRPPVVYYPQPIFVQPPPPQVYVPPPVYYYQQPVQPQQRCELRSEIINGQLVQGTYCY